MEHQASFTVSIPTTREAPEGMKKVVFYQIEIAKPNNEKLNVEKRYAEFDALDKKLKDIYINTPSLPGKSYITLDRTTKIQKRREGLEHYLKKLAERSDVVSSVVFKQFLRLDVFAPEVTVTPPKYIGTLDGLSMGVRDFLYQADDNVLFVAVGEVSVSERVGSFFSNIKKVWDKNVPEENLKSVGAVECYIQNEGIEKRIQFQKLWSKNFQTQIFALEWHKESSRLFIGGDDGYLTVLKVSVEEKFCQYEELFTFHLHNARIMNFFYDPVRDFLYSGSKDIKFKVFDVQKRAVVADLYCGDFQYTFEQKGLHEVSFGAFDGGKFKITGLVGDLESNRVIISNKDGRVFIYNIKPIIPELLHSFLAHEKGAIRGLYFDPKKNYVIAPDYEDGMISFFDIQKFGEEGNVRNVANLLDKQKVRFVTWMSAKAELCSGCESGNITFWNARKAAPIYAMKAHSGGVTKLQLIEKAHILITAGKDKKISFYELPETWVEGGSRKSSLADEKKE